MIKVAYANEEKTFFQVFIKSDQQRNSDARERLRVTKILELTVHVDQQKLRKLFGKECRAIASTIGNVYRQMGERLEMIRTRERAVLGFI